MICRPESSFSRPQPTSGIRSAAMLGIAMLSCLTLTSSATAQLDDPPSAPQQQTEPTETTPSTPDKVDVDPLADDDEIERRLTQILSATNRFENPAVRVDEGVVFLTGTTSQEQFRTWAGDLARKTQDVVAVVNEIEVVEGSIWDLSPAWREVRNLIRELVQAIPLIALAILMLMITWFAAGWAVRLASWLLETRIANPLLRNVTTRAVAIPVFLMGLYFILRVSGLTQMAATVLGGTGLIGLIVGIAFRDIAENFLASILISMQRPFVSGDLIELEGYLGYVQSVTTRGTLLMTRDGNHVQIPNSAVYKAVIQNYTANPAMRLNFVIGIGYEDSVTQAQEVALQVIQQHPVVLDDPEPLVLVDELGASTVNLHVYFWINVHETSELKARSSVVRLVKRAFEKAGISMPDEAREVVFPKGVPVKMPVDATDQPAFSTSHEPQSERLRTDRDDEVATSAEGDLSSEAAEINQQAEQSRRPDEGRNLLDDEPSATTPSR